MLQKSMAIPRTSCTKIQQGLSKRDWFGPRGASDGLPPGAGEGTRQVPEARENYGEIGQFHGVPPRLGEGVSGTARTGLRGRVCLCSSGIAAPLGLENPASLTS